MALITGREQRPLELAGAGAGRLGVARRDRGPGHVDEQRVGQARVDQGAGEGVDRGRAHHRRFSLRSIWQIVLADAMGDSRSQVTAKSPSGGSR